MSATLTVILSIVFTLIILIIRDKKKEKLNKKENDE
jgi:hypothetical protein